MKPIAKEKTNRKLGFTHLETTEIVVKLNKLLANYQVHFHKLQNFHWNVQGRDFFDLHEQFETMYTRAFKNIDEIAERIRVFGKSPASTMPEYLELAELKQPSDRLNGESMAKEILKDLEVLLSFMVDVTDTAATNGDVGTADMITGFIKQMEKDHWMLTAWLQSIEA